MQLTKEQIKFLNDVCNGTWTLNSNGEVDVDGNVYMCFRNLTEIPVRFGRVVGYFSCSFNHLKNLKNCPSEVGDHFNITYNNLTTLDYFPEKIKYEVSVQSYNPTLTNYFNNLKDDDFKKLFKLLDTSTLMINYPFLINKIKDKIPKLKLKNILTYQPITKLYLE